MTSPSQRKGAAGEREVVEMWRAHGWPRARRNPGSGSWRPYGIAGEAPMPGDIGDVDPFLVEVKLDKEMARPGMRSGIRGEGFVRRTLTGLVDLALDRPEGVPKPIPIMFGRPGLGEGLRAWRVWAPVHLVYAMARGVRPPVVIVGALEQFVELPWWAFFPLIGTEEDWR